MRLGVRLPGRWLVLAGAAVVAVAVLTVALGVWDGEEGPVYADASDPEFVALGRDIYAEQCAACHGIGLQGQPNWQTPLPTGGRPAPPHDASGHTWHHPDTVLFELTRNGGQAFSPPDYRNNMPAFKDALSDEEILAVLAFIKSTWPEGIRARQEQVNRRIGRQ